MTDTSISKDDTAILKGIAIVMMVSGHIMATEWMGENIEIWDLYVNDIPLATIISDIFNYCVAIFAFISGYVWAREWPVPKEERPQY